MLATADGMMDMLIDGFTILPPHLSSVSHRRVSFAFGTVP